jgi:hypothetical protein
MVSAAILNLLCSGRFHTCHTPNEKITIQTRDGQMLMVLGRSIQSTYLAETRPSPDHRMQFWYEGWMHL